MMASGCSAVIVLMVAYQCLPCHAAASRRLVRGACWRDAWPSAYWRSSPELSRLFLLFLHRRDASRTPLPPGPRTEELIDRPSRTSRAGHSAAVDLSDARLVPPCRAGQDSGRIIFGQGEPARVASGPPDRCADTSTDIVRRILSQDERNRFEAACRARSYSARPCIPRAVWHVRS